MIWKPTGKPSGAWPHGMLIAGMPARSAGIVNTSDRYMASGSAVFSPSRNAVVGDVGQQVAVMFAVGTQDAAGEVERCPGLR